MFGLGYQELLLILLIVLLIFGGRKIPELAKGLGRSIREFKNARHEVNETAREEEKEEEDRRKDRDKTGKPPPRTGGRQNESSDN